MLVATPLKLPLKVATEVDVAELLKRPNVQKIIQQVAENTTVEGVPREGQEAAVPTK